MHRQTLVVLACCVLLAAVSVLILEVHRDHQHAPAVPVAGAGARGAIAPPAYENDVIAVELPRAKPRALIYSGNTKTYKFHINSCRYADCTNCTAHFATRGEAIEAGYRPCGTCRP